MRFRFTISEIKYTKYQTLFVSTLNNSYTSPIKHIDLIFRDRNNLNNILFWNMK